MTHSTASINNQKLRDAVPIVLSAPSGAGKTTIAGHLLKADSNITPSVSCTTRAPRHGEKDGFDYFFINKEQFKKKIAENEFLEWAEVHNQYYGTPLGALNKKLKEGRDVLLIIDVQGAVSVRKIYPNGIFIMVVPPTWAVLEERLKARDVGEKTDFKLRLENAKKELTFVDAYDYVVVNDNLDEAVQDILTIIRSETLSNKRLQKDQIPIFSEIKGS